MEHRTRGEIDSRARTPSRVLADSIPKYLVIEGDVRSRVERGELVSGDRLPTEDDLSRAYSVSRSVVRQALRNLEVDQIIVRKRAKGTFIADPPIHVSLNNAFSFAEEVAGRGVVATSKVVAHRWDAPSLKVSSLLGVGPTESCLRLERIRLGNGVPMGFDTTWIHPSVAIHLRDSDLSHSSLLDLYAEKAGKQVESISRELRAASATEAAARHLNVVPGSPLLQVDRVVRDTSDAALDVQSRLYNSGMFTIRMSSAAWHREPVGRANQAHATEETWPPGQIPLTNRLNSPSPHKPSPHKEK